ncbi:MFS transporter [Microbacterium soli]|uniref:MFS transporter n=1 Tax=Microbacterium soli TaxID=446075 RepID=UPI003CD07F19
MIAVTGLGGVLGSLLGDWIVQRFGERIELTETTLSCAAVLALTTVAVWTTGLSALKALFVAVLLVSALLDGMWAVVRQSMVAELVSNSHRGRAMTLYGASQRLGRMTGPWPVRDHQSGGGLPHTCGAGRRHGRHRRRAGDDGAAGSPHEPRPLIPLRGDPLVHLVDEHIALVMSLGAASTASTPNGEGSAGSGVIPQRMTRRVTLAPIMPCAPAPRRLRRGSPSRPSRRTSRPSR